MTEFIFMLTHNDATLSDALEVYDTLRDIEDLRYVGFKDVGAPFEQLKALADAIRADGRTSMLEVVSEDAAAELRSIEAARAPGRGLGPGRHARGRGTAVAGGERPALLPVPGHRHRAPEPAARHRGVHR